MIHSYSNAILLQPFTETFEFTQRQGIGPFQKHTAFIGNCFLSVNM